MDLPLKYKVFDFEYTDDFGKKFDGQFTVLCRLTISQKHTMELEKTRLLGNYANPTDALAGYAIYLSTLRAKIVDAPEWWKQSGGGASIEDEEILIELYNKIAEAEIQWKEEMMKKAKPETEKEPVKASQ